MKPVSARRDEMYSGIRRIVTYFTPVLIIDKRVSSRFVLLDATRFDDFVCPNGDSFIENIVVGTRYHDVNDVVYHVNTGRAQVEIKPRLQVYNWIISTRDDLDFCTIDSSIFAQSSDAHHIGVVFIWFG